MKIIVLTHTDFYKPRKDQEPEKLKIIYLFTFGTLLLILPLMFEFFWHGHIIPFIICATYVVFVSSFLLAHFLDIKFSAHYYIAIGLLVLLFLASVYENGAAALYWLYPLIVGVALTTNPKVGVASNLIVCILAALMVYPDLSRHTLQEVVFSALIVMLFSHGSVHILIQLQEKLLKSSFTDPLTRLYNRRYLAEVGPKCVSESKRHQIMYVALMVDIDHFKKINDLYGHGVGDQVIIGTANLLSGSCRVEDLIFRMGGEEYLIIARVKDVNGMKQLAELVRYKVQEATILKGHSVSVSIGGAILAEDSDHDQWISQADSALYQAKEQGRNRCIFYTDSHREFSTAAVA